MFQAKIANPKNERIKRIFERPLFLWTFLRLWGGPGSVHDEASIRQLRAKMNDWDDKNPYVAPEPTPKPAPSAAASRALPVPTPASQPAASIPKVPASAPSRAKPSANAPSRPKPSAPAPAGLKAPLAVPPPSSSATPAPLPQPTIVVKTKRPRGKKTPANDAQAGTDKDARDEAGQHEANDSDADDSATEPTAKRVKFAEGGKPRIRGPAVRGDRRNTTQCPFCKQHGYECWRQGGPCPRGSCFECSRGKVKCAFTPQFGAELKEERKKLRKANRQSGVSGPTTTPRPSANAKTATPPASRPMPSEYLSVMVAKKPETRPAPRPKKSTKSRAVVASSSDSELVTPRQKKGTFAGMPRLSTRSFFTDIF